MRRKKVIERWAILHRSKNKIDGSREWFEFENCLPKFFNKRKDAREYASEKYGYIKTRLDLRAEPHGWKMPQAIRVKIIIQEQAQP